MNLQQQKSEFDQLMKVKIAQLQDQLLDKEHQLSKISSSKDSDEL